MTAKVCSREECPSASIKAERSTNCARCGALVHLLCIGINMAVSEVMWHANICVLCAKCCAGDDAASANKPKMRQTSITDMRKWDKILTRIDDLEVIAKDVQANVAAHREETKKTAASVDQLSKAASERFGHAQTVVLGGFCKRFPRARRASAETQVCSSRFCRFCRAIEETPAAIWT